MKLSIQITNKTKKYIVESLKDNNIVPTQKNLNRVLRELKSELIDDMENIIDEVIMDISSPKPNEQKDLTY